MFKLALTAGHYLGTPGKRCLKSIDPNETREWWLNDRIADKIQKLLSEYKDIEILRTDDTTGHKSIELEDRVKAANTWGADFYLSVHHNAGINGGSGGGIMNYIYKNASSASAEWAKDLYDELVALTGLKGNRSEPIQKANLYETKYTNAPAVLMELGFMDSRTDVPVILTEEYATRCAQACVNVIVKRAKLQKNASKPAPAPAPAPSVSSTILKRGSEGESVERLQNLLNLLGYNCGDSDGDFGPNTEKAVIAFQKAYKLSVDGKYGPASHAAMQKALTSTSIIFKLSYTKSNQVKAMQEIINDFGYDCGTPDGVYGNKTVDGVRDFQRSRGLSTDGICGPKTIAKFKEYLSL